MIGFDPADTAKGREFLRVIARPYAVCPAETVLLIRDAVVLDGSHVVARDGQGVRESFYNVPPDGERAARLAARLAPRLAGRLAAGDVAALPEAGLPVVALFLQDCNNFGHLLAEHLPRLLHLEAIGLRDFRLLLPDAAAPFRAVIDFTLHALGLRAEMVACPEGSAVRVAALHFPTLVGEGWFKSPTVLRLFERLRAAVPPMGRVERLYVARPASGRRRVVNAAALATLAEAAGYAVVEPSRLAFAAQIGLFAGARRVLGPMGAALTLTATMAQGGRVGVIGPGYCDYFYWDLACLAGLDFDWAFTEPLAPFSMALLEREMTIPPASLRRLIEWQEG